MRRELAGLAVGVVLVAAVLALLDVERVVSNISRARTDIFATALVVGLGGIGLLGTALGWLRRALDPDTEAAPLLFLLAFLRAYFVRLVIPIGSSGAPAIYAYVLHREFDTPFEEELAVATAAELLSYGASAGLAIGGMAVFTAQSGAFAYARPVSAALGLIFSGVVGAFVVLWFAPGRLDRVVLGGAGLVNRTAGRLSTRVAAATSADRVRDRLALFHETTAMLAEQPRTLAVTTGLTVLAWVCLSAPLWLVARALGSSAPFALVLVAVPVSGFMYVLPVSGGLGGVEVAVGTLLVAGAGVSVPVAAATVLLYRVATYWAPLVVAGIATAARPTGLPTGK